MYNFDEIIDRHGTNCEKWDGLQDNFGKKDLTSLWVADMDFKAPPEIIETLKERVEHGIFGYTYYPDSWYEAFIDWTERRHKWKVEKEWITHSPGIVTAMGLAVMAFTEPGDSVLIQPPVYPHFEDEIIQNGRKVVLNPLTYVDGRFEMDLEDLREKISGVKMMFLCSPHNPAGRVWTEKELKAVAELCIENDVIIASDEIHADIVYGDNVHHPIPSLSREIQDRSAVFMAPSKTFNIAGLKASAIIIPNKKLRDKFNSVLDRVHVAGGTCMAIPAFETAYRKGEPWLEELLTYLEGNIQFIEDFLAEKIPSIKLVKPEGTYIPFIDMKSLNMSPDKLHSFLIEAGLAMNSGASFGAGGEGFARINIATPRSVIEEGLKKIEKAVKSL